MKPKLTAKQKRFIDFYLQHYNAARAAREAGYSEKSAKEIGNENLTKPHIKAAIDKENEKTADELGITRRRVLNEWAKLAFTDLPDLVDENGDLLRFELLPESAKAAIQEVTTSTRTRGDETYTDRKVKLHSKTGALDALSKHLKLFTDVLDINANGPFVVRWAKTEKEADV